MQRSPGAFDRAAPLLALLCSLLIAQATILASRAQPLDSSLEYQVKAAVIYNFTKFIEWPQPPSGANGDSHFEMCLFGDKQVMDLMRNTVRGKLVRGSVVAVREIAQPSETAGCELLFITRSEEKRFSNALAAAPTGVLTIAEAPGLQESGAMINLVLDEGRVGFEIDIERANRSGFKISSNLLRLARSAEPGGRR